MKHSEEILAMALIGYTQVIEVLTERSAAVYAEWQAASKRAKPRVPKVAPKRKMSAAGRAAIVAGQKKRWAAARSAKKAA
jgi:hypothetical protein